jgi:hypothetical protein
MINWFKKENYKDYQDRLLNAFPLTLKDDVETVFDILPFDINNVKLFGGQVHKVDNLINANNWTVQLDSKPLTIPYRLYFNEPDKAKENKLTDTQKTILNCIYLRHHDGHVRQRRLEQLVDANEYWVTPFTLQLLGEYVFEILVVLDKHLTDQHLDNYVRFIKENPKYWKQTDSRMISYWNEYYRGQYPKLKDYLGRQLADRIKKRTHNTG